MVNIQSSRVRYSDYILFFFLFAVSEFTSAQSSDEKIRFSRIGVDAGLSNSNITAILQDSKGFIWVGTRDGLNKYDGYDFVVYRNIEGDTSSLLRNFILCLFEDSQGNIWASTQGGGLHRYDPKKNIFTRFKQFSSDVQIDKILEGSDHSIWVAGNKEDHIITAQFNRAKNEWSIYNVLKRTDEEVKVFMQDSKDEFWIGGRRAGFFKWNKKTNSIDPNLKNDIAKKIVNNDVHTALADDDGNIWIGTHKGLSKFNVKDGHFTNFTYNPSIPSTSVLNFPILDISKQGNFLWLGTENAGLSRLDLKKEQFSNFTFDKNDATSLSDNSVWAVYKDRQERIWLGTFSRGLCVFDKNNNKFSQLDIPLDNDVVNAIHQDHQGRLWIGTEAGLVMNDGKKIKHYSLIPKNEKGTSGNAVLSIYEDSKENIWVGTWASGLHRYDETMDRFIAYLPNDKDPESISDRDVFTIKEYSKTQQLLVGCFGGLNVLTDEKAARFTHHYDAELINNNNLLTLLEDSQGRLWTGSTWELNQYSIETGKRTRFDLSNASDGIKMNEPINCVFESLDNRIWVGTGYGLFQIIDDSHFKRYTMTNGLPSNSIMAMLEDDHGNLWISTDNGLSRFNPQTESFRNFDINDGLSSNEFKRNACYKNKDGLFFFGGKGINVFHPDSIQLNNQNPQVFISDFKVFNRSLEINGEDGILTKPISEATEIALPSRYNFFTIAYVALNFSDTQKNTYRYKLEGFDNDWINVGHQRTATYTNLDAGTYTFRVMARNNDGLWNEEGTQLIIRVMPPWWNTWWMKLAIAVLIIGIVILIYRLRIRNRYIDQLTQLKDKLESEKYMIDFLLENLPVLIYIKDKESRFLRVSKFMGTSFKKDVTDIIGKTDFDIQDEKHAQEAFEDEQEIIRTGKAKLQYLEKELHDDGTEKWVSSSKAPFLNHAGEVIGTIGISADVTQVKHYNDELLLREEEIKSQNEELHSQREELATKNEALERNQVEISEQNKKLIASEEELTQNVEELKAVQDTLEETNKELAIRETQLRQIFNAVPAMIFQFKMTPDGGISFPIVSKGSIGLYGLEPQALMNDPMSVIGRIHPEDLPIYAQALAESGNILDKEVKLELRTLVDGKVKWVQVTWVAERLEDGLLSSGIVLDISKRRQAEFELKRTQEILEQTNHLARVGGWEFDLVKKKVTWSKVTKDINEVGPDFEPDLYSGLNVYKEGENKTKITKAIEQIKKDGIPFDITLQAVSAKGNERWIRSIGHAEFKEKECTRIYGVVQDVDDQVKANLALAESERNFRQINESIEEVFWLFDVNTLQLIYISPSCEKVLGENAAFFYDGHWMRIILEDDTEKIRNAHASLEEGHSAYEIEYKIKFKSGEIRWIHEKAFAIKNTNGVYIRTAGICSDVTEKKRIQDQIIKSQEEIELQNRKLVEQSDALAAQNEELIQSSEEIMSQRDKLQSAQIIIEEQNQQIKSRNENLEDEVAKRIKEIIEYNHQLEQFAFISAHNLRAPVARILGLGQVLTLPGQRPGEKEEVLEKLIRTTVELDTVVRDLNKILEIRKESNQPITELNLYREIELAEAALQHEIDACHAVITKDFSRSESLKTVKPYLDSILTNLLSNAIKYRHPRRDPQIKISSYVVDNYICLCFSDNGLGIDLKVYGEKMFTLYKRFHFHIDGKGLGLYLVKNQVDSLGGKIEVESVVDEGTTFRIYFKRHF